MLRRYIWASALPTMLIMLQQASFTGMGGVSRIPRVSWAKRAFFQPVFSRCSISFGSRLSGLSHLGKRLGSGTPSPPHAARIDDDLGLQQFAIDALELPMVHQENDDVGLRKGVSEFRQPDLRCISEADGQLREIRLDHEKLTDLLFGQRLYDVQSGALAEIVDIGFVGESQAGNDRSAQTRRSGFNLLQHEVRLLLVYRSRRTNDRCLLGSRRNDEPRIDGNTMSANAGAGGQNIYARVFV